MGFFDGVYDSFMGLFGGGSSDTGLSSTQTSVLNDIDLDGDSTIGGVPINQYGSAGFAPNLTHLGDNNGYNTQIGGFDFSNPNAPTKVEPSAAPFYTNPNLLGAAITAGAGLFQGMSALDVQKQALKAQQEKDKMNNLLELAKLKNQILMKGSSGSGGGRRAGGSGGAGQAEAVDRQYSANKISQLSSLGANLANIYKG